jgi:hypothetical protein
MTGILVHGDNHFIVRGPKPERDVALALVRHWSVIQIGVSDPVSTLLDELKGRGIRVWHTGSDATP